VPYLLPIDRYNDIRYALDPTLGDEAVPDDIIASDLFLGEAERWVLANDPSAGTRTGEELKAVYRAIIYYTAGLLSQGTPQNKQENMAGHSATLSYAETASERTARLLGLAQAALDTYLVEIETITLVGAPVFVTTVSGRRA
jgi:hypothetical protein